MAIQEIERNLKSAGIGTSKQFRERWGSSMQQAIKLNYCGNMVDAFYDGDDTKAIEAAESFVEQMQERVSKAYPRADVSVSTDWTVSCICNGCEIEGFTGNAPLDHIAAIEVALLCEIS